MNSELIRLAHAGLNPDTVRKLVDDVGPSTAVRRVRSSARTNPLTKAALDISVDERIEALRRVDAEIIDRADERFPGWLAALPDAPLWLFVRGSIPSQPGVAIVGSRRATRYGIEVAHALGSRVAAAGWSVISGLAIGIDAAAHRGAIAATGSTVAVLGSGIDVWYPRQNRSVGEELLAIGGAVISEFPPGTTPEPWRFPARNRIISGLCEVVIVVEAAVKSGALITARCALDHGRFVMAVPGDLSRKTSAGTNMLIRDGAHPLTEIDAIVEELELVMGPAPHDAPVRVEIADESELLASIGHHAISIDQLAADTGVDVPTLLAQVAMLEMTGTVRMESGVVRRT